MGPIPVSSLMKDSGSLDFHEVSVFYMQADCIRKFEGALVSGFIPLFCPSGFVIFFLLSEMQISPLKIICVEIHIHVVYTIKARESCVYPGALRSCPFGTDGLCPARNETKKQRMEKNYGITETMARHGL